MPPAALSSAQGRGRAASPPSSTRATFVQVRGRLGPGPPCRGRSSRGVRVRSGGAAWPGARGSAPLRARQSRRTAGRGDGSGAPDGGGGRGRGWGRGVHSGPQVHSEAQRPFSGTRISSGTAGVHSRGGEDPLGVGSAAPEDGGGPPPGRGATWGIWWSLGVTRGLLQRSWLVTDGRVRGGFDP